MPSTSTFQLILTPGQSITIQFELQMDKGNRFTISIVEPKKQGQTIATEVHSPAASAEAKGYGERRAEIENRSYHMGAKPTTGPNYDDRLVVRLGCSSNTAYSYMKLPERRGGLRHRRMAINTTLPSAPSESGKASQSSSGCSG